VPIPVIGDLEKDKLPGAERVDGLTDVSKGFSAKMNLLHTANVNVAMSAQKKLLHMVRMLKTWLISCKIDSLTQPLTAAKTYLYGK
jgi:hypothetical protein